MIHKYSLNADKDTSIPYANVHKNNFPVWTLSIGCWPESHYLKAKRGGIALRVWLKGQALFGSSVLKLSNICILLWWQWNHWFFHHLKLTMILKKGNFTIPTSAQHSLRTSFIFFTSSVGLQRCATVWLSHLFNEQTLWWDLFDGKDRVHPLGRNHPLSTPMRSHKVRLAPAMEMHGNTF